MLKIDQMAEIEKEIRARAYQLFINRGRIHGDDLKDWLEAECIVKKSLSLKEAGVIDFAYLLRQASECPNILDFYITGCVFLYESDLPLAKWIKKTVYQLIVCIDNGTNDSEQKLSTKSALTEFLKAPRGNLVNVKHEESNAIFDQIINANLFPEDFYPISHILLSLEDKGNILIQKEKYLYVLTILSIIFGGIAAAIYRAKNLGNESSFNKELKLALSERAADWETLLNLYLMFHAAGEMALAGHKVEILGTAGNSAGGPDFKVNLFDSHADYYFEVWRRDPKETKSEAATIELALRDGGRLKKVVNGINSPCIFMVDITSLPRNPNKASLLRSEIINLPNGTFAYRAYRDNNFSGYFDRDGNSVYGSVKTRLLELRSEGYGVAGVIISRVQYLKITTDGVAEAYGSVMILDKTFEGNIPWGIASVIYLV